MQRPPEYFFDIRRFHNLPRIHHRYFLRRLGDNAQIMCDQDHRHVVFFLELGNQAQDLRLNGHIQRSCGFVREQQLRTTGHGHGDHHTLAHASAQLMGIVSDASRRFRNADFLQKPDTYLQRLRGGYTPMQADRFGNLISDA